MHFTKIFISIGSILTIGLFGCTAEKKSESPKQEQVTKDLVPPKSELQGQNFLVQLTDLRLSRP